MTIHKGALIREVLNGGRSYSWWSLTWSGYAQLARRLSALLRLVPEKNTRQLTDAYICSYYTFGTNYPVRTNEQRIEDLNELLRTVYDHAYLTGWMTPHINFCTGCRKGLPSSK